ncbi:MAG: nicotinamidase-like amidase [Herbinix sp.]|jgi:nicotinamidase-related amidase|nr:nicotinamidase-like amidase [Herbinix sp.]
MSNIALLVVDVQNAIVDEHPYNGKKVIENIETLLSVARANHKEVIYIQHEEAGCEFEHGCDGWQIYTQISPVDSEKIIEKNYNSAFVKTELKDYLSSKNITTLVLVGMQTDYCIDATCKGAFEHGYQVIIPEATNATFDNEYLTGEKLYEYYNHYMWDNRYAKLLSIKETIQLLEQ